MFLYQEKQKYSYLLCNVRIFSQFPLSNKKEITTTSTLVALQKWYDWGKKKYTDDLDKDYVELKELSGKIYSDWYCDMKALEHMSSIYLYLLLMILRKNHLLNLWISWVKCLTYQSYTLMILDRHYMLGNGNISVV